MNRHCDFHAACSQSPKNTNNARRYFNDTTAVTSISISMPGQAN
jgi:hypothetical protein